VASAGFDGCSTASNHSLDRGFAGVTATLDAFDANALGHAGTARTAEEGAAVRTYDVQGVAVAHLSYSYGFNGYQLPADAPFAANQIDPARIRADAARAVAGGAQLVVVSLHFGNEYQHEPSTYQREVVADLLTSSDIGLVIGHHAHVVQPISRIDQRYVVWGLGNQLSNQTQAPRTDGLTVVVTAEPGARGPRHRWVVRAVEAVPTWVDRPSFRILPVVDALADPAVTGALRADLLASYDRTASIALAERPPGVTIDPRPAG
jgi:poly-gamma-glutamate synthesis protein (capsule biosynthesis protein)